VSPLLLAQQVIIIFLQQFILLLMEVYRKPQKRIFLFIDPKSATTLAEKLGTLGTAVLLIAY
jgi:hypothetical protein